MAEDLLLHNWVERVKVRTSWLTDVTASPGTLAEQRLGLLTQKPKRTIEVTWTAWDAVLALRLMTLLHRASSTQARIPLYCDQARTTASSSGTTINCPTTFRRFTVGSQGVIHERDSNGRPTNPQFFTVTGKTDTTLTLESALTGSYPTGSEVFPILVCHEVLAAKGRAYTDGAFEVHAIMEEVLGPAALDPVAAEEANQVMILEPDWTEQVEVGLARPGQSHSLGRSHEVEPQGTRPSFTFSFTVTEFSREDAFDALSIFDGARGRLQPLYLVSPLVVFEPVSISANQVDVEVPAGATLADVEAWLTHLGLRRDDGTVEILTVTGVSLQAGPVWRIVFTEATDATLDEIVFLTSAHHVRFAEDEFEEQWVTDEACQVTFNFVEVQDEATYGHDEAFVDCGMV